MTEERTSFIAMIVVWVALLVVALLFVDSTSTRWWLAVVGAVATAAILGRMFWARRPTG